MRPLRVTGVQPCVLPIYALRARRAGRTLRARRTRGARRTLGTRAVRRRARPVAVLVLVTLGVGEIDGALAVAVEVPARRALRTRRTRRPARARSTPRSRRPLRAARALR